MTLQAGTRLGPYEIQSLLGAGGMGEVYKARDTRLERTVAVKVLPAQVSTDRQFRERFEHEARTISQLDHPHICALYDVGEEGNTSFLVMQYLEGETLADRLTKGPLPLDEALRYAMEVADALERAHRAGIIHRDIKPGNIMLTKSGAKLLDFGLARSGAPVLANSGFSMLPTTPAANLTAQGTILGTFQYMAPEQLEGQEADARTDIFALGAVLYEMLTGRKAFEGKSQATLIASIVGSEPAPVSALLPVAPPLLDDVVRTCLAKDPNARWQSAADLRQALGLSAKHRAPVAITTSAATHRSARLRWTLAGVVLLSAMAAAAWFAFVLGARMMRPGSRVMFDVMTDVTPSPLHLALSPDGTRLISVVSTEDRTGLWMRRLDSVSGQLLAPAASIVSTGSFPFWSPDGRFVAYFALDKLNKVDVTGGPAQPLCDVAGGGLGGTWSRNGTILFASGAKDTLFKVPAAGGVAAPVTELDKSRGDLAHRHPKFLPDGNHFVFFVVNQKQEATGVYLGSLDSKETRQLTTSDAMGAFVPPDYLAFVRGSTLMVQHFDLDRLQLTGDPVPAMQEVGINTGNSVGGYTFSDNGVLAIRVGATINERRLRWFDRTGKPLGDVGAIGPHENVALAADGARLAETRPDAAGGDIWIFDLSRNTSTRFTFGTARDDNSIWSPDSNSIVYASARGGVQNLYVKSANGAEQEQLLLKSDYSDYPTDWSRDGKYILYTESKNGSDIWVLPLAGDKKPIPFLTTSFFENQARFSSDGRWIAYTSDESGGARQVYVQGFPDKTGKWQVSISGGTDPHWTKNGREIVYQGVGGIWSVDVDGTGPAFKAGVPKKLFDQSGIGGGPVVTRFAPAADGQRILINLTAQATTATPPIRVVVNWATGLDER